MSELSDMSNPEEVIRELEGRIAELEAENAKLTYTLEEFNELIATRAPREIKAIHDNPGLDEVDRDTAVSEVLYP